MCNRSPLRYALTEQPAALTKLLKCVDWGEPREAAHARQMAERGVGLVRRVSRNS